MVLEHAIWYPPEWLNVEPRELARLSQTDVTAFPPTALQYAAAAVDRAREPEVRASGPTLAGECAAKLAFHGAKLIYHYGVYKVASEQEIDRPSQGITIGRNFVENWIAESYRELSRPNSADRRERIATTTLYTRSVYLLIASGQMSVNPWIKERIRTNRAVAEETLKGQHQRGQPYDRYGTMLDSHSAVFEAMYGSGVRALALAARGIHRARHAASEDQSPENHAHFVYKHHKANLAAGWLAVQKIVSFVPKVQRNRKRLAGRLSG